MIISGIFLSKYRYLSPYEAILRDVDLRPRDIPPKTKPGDRAYPPFHLRSDSWPTSLARILCSAPTKSLKPSLLFCKRLLGGDFDLSFFIGNTLRTYFHLRWNNLPICLVMHHKILSQG